MIVTPSVLDDRWSSIKCVGGCLQLDIGHPLEWYVGRSSAMQPVVFLISSLKVGSVESSRAMLVSSFRRERDKRWTLRFELRNEESRDVFAILCSDIIEHSRSADSEEDALKLVLRRCEQWKHLLERQPSGAMSTEQQKGLVGELLFLEERVKCGYALLSSVQGWVGADGSDQDFAYSDGWFEIKAVGEAAIGVEISSLEQLGKTEPGELVVWRIDKAAPESVGVFSLRDLVSRVDALLKSDDNAHSLFQDKLFEYGYVDMSQYSEQMYCCSGCAHYRVTSSFPRLTRAQVPVQVSRVTYTLNLPSLVDWRQE